MKKLSIISAILLSSTLLLGACSNNEPYTKEEEKEVLTELITEDIATTDSLSFKSRMDKELSKLSLNASSDLIDAWLYTLYSKVSESNTKIVGFQKDLLSLYKDDIDVTKKANVGKVKDPVLKAFLDDVYKHDVRIKREGEEFFIEPDFVSIKKEYKKYMREDMLAYIDLSIDETEKPFFNKEKETFDLTVIAERIISLESMLKKYPKSVYVDSFKQTQVYYYQLYFGMNNALLMDESGKTYLEEVVNTYRVHADTYKDTEFATDVAKVVKIMDANNGKLSADLTTALTAIVNERAPETWVESSNDEGVKEKTNSEMKEQNIVPDESKQGTSK